MRIIEVTKEDGLALAHLLNVFKAARFTDLSGSDIEKVVEAKKWLQGIAVQAAEHLRKTEAPSATPAPASSTGFKVKAMGPLPSTSNMRKTRKKK